MKTLIALILICAQSWAIKPESEYWSKTQIDRSLLLEKFLTQENCSDNFSAFVSCVRALEQIVEQINPPRMLIARSLTKSSNISALKMELGNLAVAQFKLHPFNRGSARTRNEKKRFYFEREMEELHKLYKLQNDSNTAINFPIVSKAIIDQYLDKDNEASEIASAINAYYRNLYDPHSRISPTEYLQADWDQSGQNNFGLGLRARPLGDQLEIIDVMPDSPAANAGVKPGDILVLNDQPIKNLSASTDAEDIMNQYLGGVEGSLANIKIRRDDKIIDFSIPRTIEIYSDVKEYLLAGKKPLGLIKIGSFISRNICKQTAQAIRALETKNIAGLILDIRNNRGGRLEEAVCVAGLFVGKNFLGSATPFDRNLTEDKYFGSTNIIFSKPLVVLQNGNTASASEMLSGNLQAYNLAWIVGDRSFGKGSYQVRKPWSLDEKVTFIKTEGRYYLANGHSTQSTGIIPNFQVPYKLGATLDQLYVPRELDLYPNAIPVIGPRWQEPRPELQKILRICVENFGSNIKISGRDYVLAWGMDLMGCLIPKFP